MRPFFLFHRPDGETYKSKKWHVPPKFTAIIQNNKEPGGVVVQLNMKIYKKPNSTRPE